LKKIKTILAALLLGTAGWAQAQTTETAPALETAPPALAAPEVKAETAAENTAPAPAAFVRKPHFSLSMGSQFSRFGQASYLQPSVALPLTRRFQAFASVQFLHSFGPGFYQTGAETGSLALRSRSQQSSVVMVGGNYAVNEKLNLTGSIWRDLANPRGLAAYPLHPFSPAGTQGMSLRAHYKINDRLSVSGGIRYGNGRGYQGYNPLLYPDYNTPFGY
jgi:hypothetical protein